MLDIFKIVIYCFNNIIIPLLMKKKYILLVGISIISFFGIVCALWFFYTQNKKPNYISEIQHNLKSNKIMYNAVQECGYGSYMIRTVIVDNFAIIHKIYSCANKNCNVVIDLRTQDFDIINHCYSEPTILDGLTVKFLHTLSTSGVISINKKFLINRHLSTLHRLLTCSNPTYTAIYMILFTKNKQLILYTMIFTQPITFQKCDPQTWLQSIAYSDL